MSSHEQSSMAKGMRRSPLHADDGPENRHPFLRRQAPIFCALILLIGLTAAPPPAARAAESWGNHDAGRAAVAAAEKLGDTAKAVAREAADGVEDPDNEPILIRAATAWEDEAGDVLYLEGGFHMQTSEWEVSADRAEVHGPVEDPEKIIGYGEPASIRVTLGDDGEGTGYSNRIVYLYRTKMLELHDNARMEMDNVTVRSAAIIYDVGRKRLVSSGKEGVEFVLQKDNTPAR